MRTLLTHRSSKPFPTVRSAAFGARLQQNATPYPVLWDYNTLTRLSDYFLLGARSQLKAVCGSKV